MISGKWKVGSNKVAGFRIRESEMGIQHLACFIGLSYDILFLTITKRPYQSLIITIYSKLLSDAVHAQLVAARDDVADDPLFQLRIASFRDPTLWRLSSACRIDHPRK